MAVVHDRPFPSRAGVASIGAVFDEADLARHRPELLRHCVRLLGSSDAEDAVQDAFLRAWTRRATYNGGSLRAWLYTIATNVCYDALSRRGRAVDAEPPEVVAPRHEEPDAVLVSRETVELAMLASIRHLPERQHASLVLRDVLGMSAAETASALSLSVPATTSALQRARCGLRRHLAPHRLEWVSVPPSDGQRERLASCIAALEAGA
jgi:RNA polymerase sigma factor (sigma-70 family)